MNEFNPLATYFNKSQQWMEHNTPYMPYSTKKIFFLQKKKKITFTAFTW